MFIKKTLLLMHPALKNISIFNKQVKGRDVEMGLMLGSLNLQHLLGPRHCRCFQPVEETTVLSFGSALLFYKNYEPT